MDEHTTSELAYKRGYEKGKQDAQKWIPVTERLPYDRQRVLAWCGCGRIYNNIAHFANCLEDISCDFEGFKHSGFYDYDSEWGYYEVTNITHWMPLPTPPKGE